MQRSSGILLHPTALPGRYGIGTLGVEAGRFIDFLADSGQRIWQVLPLGPTGYGNSPYNALSAFAGNPLMIDLDTLVAQGDLTVDDLVGHDFPEGRLDARVFTAKPLLLARAGDRFFRAGTAARRTAFETFCHDQRSWLDDFALYVALRQHFRGTGWQSWPAELRQRDPEALAAWRQRLAPDCRQVCYQQFLFFEQWSALKADANERGIRIFGDMPIFVAYDSADVWAHQELFQLDEDGQRLAMAGVPPDYFSETGQLWGNPLYDWERMRADDFRWWRRRFRASLASADLVRIDHFRGFEACWSVPAGEETALNGHWEKVPGAELFACLHDEFGPLPVVAEDLGVITEEVEQLRRRAGFPGMKVLQFAFDSGPDNPYLPDNYDPQCVVYTGTHDNNTTLGWWRALSEQQRQAVARVLRTESPEMPWDLIRLAEESVARLCLLPCQDILSLDQTARFNTPGTVDGNWNWRLKTGDLSAAIAARLRTVCQKAGRCA